MVSATRDRPVCTLVAGARPRKPVAAKSMAQSRFTPASPLRESGETGVASGQRIPDGEFGGIRLLISDTRVGLLLLNEARYRSIHRLFGVDRDQSWLVSLVALGVLGHAAHNGLRRIAQGPNPTSGDLLLGAGALREISYGIGGPSARNVPGFGALVAVGVAGHLARPVLSRSFRDLRISGDRMARAFHHRYGHLLRPSRDR